MKKILSLIVLTVTLCIISCTDDDSVEQYLASKSSQYGFTGDGNGDTKDDDKK